MKGQNYYHAHFDGSVAGYCPLFLKNLLLTILTLGIYSPWGTTNNRKYLFSHLEIAGARYLYHGKGKELLIGRLKALGILMAVILVYFWLRMMFPKDYVFTTVVFLYLFLFVMAPVAMISILRYRLSRTSWNHVRMYFTGNWQEFLPLYVQGTLLSIITLGFYTPFFTVRLYHYLINHSWVGTKRYLFDGDGGAMFHIFIKGLVFSVITCGIYYFWFLADFYHYTVSHITLDGSRYHFKATGFDFLTLILPQVLIVALSFGLAVPIAYVQAVKFFANHLYLDASFDPNNLKQAPVDVDGASAEALHELLAINY